MSVSRYEAAWRLRELEQRFLDLLVQLEASGLHSDDRFNEWVRDVETTIGSALSDSTSLREDFLGLCQPKRGAKAPEPIDDAAVIGLLRRARSILFMQTDAHLDQALTDAVQSALNKTYQKTLIFRGSAAALGFAALLFFGSVVQIQGYRLDIEDEAQKVRDEITAKGESIKKEMTAARDELLRQVDTLQDRVETTIQKAEQKATIKLESLETVVREQKERLTTTTSTYISKTIPAFWGVEMQRINQEVTLKINTDLPQRVETASKKLEAAVGEAVAQTLTLPFEEQQKRLTDATTALILKDLPDHFAAETKRFSKKIGEELGRINFATDTYINKTIPLHWDGEMKRMTRAADIYVNKTIPSHGGGEMERIGEAVDAFVTGDLNDTLESAIERVTDAATRAIKGPLNEQLETQKQAISDATLIYISNPLKAHLTLEKERLTAEADRLRNTLWVRLEAKLAEIFANEFKHDIERIELISGEIDKLRKEINRLGPAPEPQYEPQ